MGGVSPPPAPPATNRRPRARVVIALLLCAWPAGANVNEAGSGPDATALDEPAPLLPPPPPLPPLPPNPPAAPPSPPTSPIKGKVCTTCMNSRDPQSCREPWQSCVLDEPRWDDWLASGRGGANLEQSRELFLEANASFAAGLAHRVAGGEACRHGHTDVSHAEAANVGVCRLRYAGDTCANPPPQPFVCACVSEAAAMKAQDELGEDARWYFLMIGFGSVVTTVFMLLLRCLLYTSPSPRDS